jgi:hypothetical protein
MCGRFWRKFILIENEISRYAHTDDPACVQQFYFYFTLCANLTCSDKCMAAQSCLTCPALAYPTLSLPTSPCLALPCSALPCPAFPVPCPVLPWPVLPCPCPASPCPFLSRPSMPIFFLTALFCHLQAFAFSCPSLPYPTVPFPQLSCLTLSCHDSYFSLPSAWPLPSFTRLTLS